jgi:hypothetical protein
MASARHSNDAWASPRQLPVAQIFSRWPHPGCRILSGQRAVHVVDGELPVMLHGMITSDRYVELSQLAPDEVVLERLLIRLLLRVS